MLNISDIVETVTSEEIEAVSSNVEQFINDSSHHCSALVMMAYD